MGQVGARTGKLLDAVVCLVRDVNVPGRVRRHGDGIAELPVAVQVATESLRTHFDRTALNGLVEALYTNRDALGQALFGRLLGRVRQTLRANIDRQMQYAA